MVDIGRQLGSQVARKLDSQVARQLGSQVAGQLASQLASQLDRQTDRQVGRQIGRYMDKQIDRQIETQVIIGRCFVVSSFTTYAMGELSRSVLALVLTAYTCTPARVYLQQSSISVMTCHNQDELVQIGCDPSLGTCDPAKLSMLMPDSIFLKCPQAYV